MNIKRITSLITIVMFICCFSLICYSEEAHAAVKTPGKVTLTSVKSADHDAIKITWKKASNAKKYQVYRSAYKNGKYVLVKTTTAKTFTNKKLTTGKKYYYKVRAINGTKKGAFSSKKYAVPTLKKVTAVKVPATTKNSIRLTWAKVNGAKGYQVFRSDSLNGTYKKVATVGENSITDQNLPDAKTYYYKIRAYKRVGLINKVGAFSGKVTASTKADIAAVTGLKVTETSYNSATLTWTKVDGADGYQVSYVREDGINNKISNIKTTKYKVTGLYDWGLNWKIDYKVRAYKVVNGKTFYGPWSGKVTAYTRLADPKKVEAQIVDGQIKVTWEKVPNASGYYIERTAWGRYEYYEEFKVTGGNITSFIDKNAPKDITLNYTVTPYQMFDGENISYNDIISNDIKIKTAEYSYEVYLLEDYSKHQLYDAVSEIIVYIKTDDPDPELFSLTTSDGSEDSVNDVNMTYTEKFDDLAGAMSTVDNFYDYYERVEGGYVCSFNFMEPGDYTVRLVKYEDSYSRIWLAGNPKVYDLIATFDVSIGDYSKAYDEWLAGIVADNTTEDMNPLEKMQSVADYLRSDEAGFRYTTVMEDRDGYVYLALGEDKYSVPYWENRRWNSYESPAALTRIALKHIGGFEAVDNMYDNYATGSAEWQRYHAICRVTYEGVDYDFIVCPVSSTGYIDGYDVPDFGDTSWMHRIK